MQFQSTRPHGARRDHESWRTMSVTVSIHAPARGATLMSTVSRYCDVYVSIHAPARGATCRDRMDSRCDTEFQSTRPHGARHACVRQYTSAMIRFNPRARTGRDIDRAESADVASRFQSTRPHGARHSTTLSIPACTYVSIHAPARGAT